MGVSIDTGGGGGKKPLDAELNLVPFIDLLVCCICFLLITAVWSKMARIDVSQRSPGSISQEEKPPELQVKVTVLIDDDGYTLTAGGSRVEIPKQGQVYDAEKLAEKLADVRRELPDKHDITVAAVDGIRYENIIQAMDVALGQKFSEIRLTDGSAAM